MAIFTLTRQLGVLQDFTSDPQVLYAALQHFLPVQQQFATSAIPASAGASATTARETVASLDPASTPVHGNIADSCPRSGSGSAILAAQRALASFAAAEAAYDLDQRVQLTLTALNSIARILGGLPGRKSIIWVTGAFPFTLIPEDRTVSEEELTENLPGVQEHRGEQRASGNYAATSRTSNAEGIRETSARLASAQVSI